MGCSFTKPADVVVPTAPRTSSIAGEPFRPACPIPSPPSKRNICEYGAWRQKYGI